MQHCCHWNLVAIRTFVTVGTFIAIGTFVAIGTFGAHLEPTLSPFRQETLDMGVFILYIPYGKSRLRVFRKVTFGAPEIPTLLEVFGAWMTFKKAEMAKTP